MRVPRKTALSWVAVSLSFAVHGPARAEVEINPVPPSTRWPASTSPGALQRACSPTGRELEEFFGRERLPFRNDLIQGPPGRVCHLLYRPSAPGFRAAPDDDPITQVLLDSDPLLYLATARNHGEPVGAMREVLRSIRRPLDVRILIHAAGDDAVYEEATARSFGSTPHRVTLVERGVERSFWWVQDYLKSGKSPAGPTILIPHRLFEGSSTTSELFEPLLARLARQERAVRSRLSWEGGDLQFTRDPRDPRRLVLYYGNFAKDYWGEALTQAEFEYVLGLEFGADRAVDLSGLAPHVDYFVSFLPRARTALVSLPVSGDVAVARAAANALSTQFGNREPSALAELRHRLSAPTPDMPGVREAVKRARRQQPDWALSTDPGLPDRMNSLMARLCPERKDCFSPARRLPMVAADRDLFETWVYAVQRSRDEQAIIGAHLDLVESQVDPVPEDYRRRALDKVTELERTGLRVIRVPAYRVDLRSQRSWPGISYVNGLVVDQQIFLPRFGLGEVEDMVFRDLGRELPPGYSIVAVEAQRALIRNGGLHCLAGLVR